FSGAHAQSANDPPCQYSVSRQIPFTSPSAKERLTVAIGPGACHSAELSIVVRSERGKVLYSYVAPFKEHVATPWDEPSLPESARQFVNDTAAHALVAEGDLPAPKPEGEAEEGEAVLAVPASVFKRLVSSKQPMLCHATYYEG